MVVDAVPAETVGRLGLRAGRNLRRSKSAPVRDAAKLRQRRNRSTSSKSPMAAAIGAGLPIDFVPSGCNMDLVDIGGGTTSVAVISLGDIVVTQSINVATTSSIEAIIRHIRRVYNLMISRTHGRRSQGQNRLGLSPRARASAMEIRGRDLINSLPKMIKDHKPTKCAKRFRSRCKAIIEAVKFVLEKAPARSWRPDILDHGVILCDGGALLARPRAFATRRSDRHSRDRGRRTALDASSVWHEDPAMPSAIAPLNNSLHLSNGRLTSLHASCVARERRNGVRPAGYFAVAAPPAPASRCAEHVEFGHGDERLPDHDRSDELEPQLR